MTSELISRLPLTGKQPQMSVGPNYIITSSASISSSSCSSSVPQHQLDYQTKPDATNYYSTTDKSLSTSVHNSTLSTEEESSPKSRSPFQTLDNSNALGVNQNSNVHYYMHNTGFRYHIRRPVESWKFYETNKTDGSVMYLCRLCGSSYKHKKSLNKHWKDKHTDSNQTGSTHPNGDVDDADDDDDDDDPEDYEDSDPSMSQTQLSVAKSESVQPLGLVSSTMNPIVISHDDKENIPPRMCSNSKQPVDPNLNPSSIPNKRLSLTADRINRPYVVHRRSSFLPRYRSSLPMQHAQVIGDSPNADGVGLKRSRYSRFSPINVKQQQQQLIHPEPQHFEQPLQGRDSFETGDSLGSPTAKRRNSIQPISNPNNRSVLPTQYQTAYANSTVSNAGLTLSTIYSTPMENSNLVEASNLPSLSNASAELVQETQPLDLSLVKPCDISTVQEVKQPEPSTTSPPHANPAKKKTNNTKISRSLLIGLLQTALGILENETSLDTGHDEDDSDDVSNMQSLSTTSQSLLLAIGTLLTNLAGKKQEQQSPNSVEVTSKNNLIPDKVSPLPESIRSGILDGDNKSRESDHDSKGTDLGKAGHSFQTVAVPNQGIPDNHYRQCSPLVVPLHGYHQPVPQQHPHVVVSDPGNHLVRLNEQSAFTTSIIKPATPSTPSIPLSNLASTMPFPSPDLSPPSSRKRLENTDAVILCPVCNFDARWFSELRAHMVNHSEHRMFGCCYCPYRAKWKWDVAKHMRRCPLGRHVAHLQNEALLRMVRYYPPPVEDVLYSYFPHDEFPGVGIDHPPTPPPPSAPHTVSITVHGEIKQTIRDQSITETSRTDQQLNQPSSSVRAAGPSSISDVSSLPGSSYSTQTQQFQSVNNRESDEQIMDNDQSPPGSLIIVDNESPEVSKPTGDMVNRNPVIQLPAVDIRTAHAVDPRSELQSRLQTSNAGLVFKLRKCPHCSFHSADENEFKTHWNSHFTTSTENQNKSEQV